MRTFFTCLVGLSFCFEYLYFDILASSHALSDSLDVTSTVLALRTLGTFDFEGKDSGFVIKLVLLFINLFFCMTCVTIIIH